MTTNRFGSSAIDRALAAEVRAEIARRPDLSVAGLADSLGIRRATLSERVNGRVAFTYSQLRLVAEALGLTVRELDSRAKDQLAREASGTSAVSA
ncbi:helix-turn-helix domain-containing protein [Cellulosimicrobium funkei]|uniref:helix-turn-helix domain-containing protein n=1 Tax=Cellulosimicrobium funkei TaxID=264251 RepID=UPI0008901FE2|nr:Helix-turn-helix [Cellulosimicrobium cellulans]